MTPDSFSKHPHDKLLRSISEQGQIPPGTGTVVYTLADDTYSLDDLVRYGRELGELPPEVEARLVTGTPEDFGQRLRQFPHS